MYDCSKDLIAFHDANVALPQTERTNMRERRDANRKRLKSGLAKNGDPAVYEHADQGSYAMRTMVQLPAGDHDIDDGTYFNEVDLKGPQGADKSALAARQMVRDALDDGSFNTAPEVLKNCVRVHYEAGYHVDVPVYRRIVEKNGWGAESVRYELASSHWKTSDARDVTAWFDQENTRQSPDATNGRQLRRMVRYIKKYSRSRSSWTGILGGFGITKLVTEQYQANLQREDRALYDTMKAVRDRLEWDLVVKHPITAGGEITSGTDDPRARKLKEKLTDALDLLQPLFAADCTRERALKCWDAVFKTTFFSDRLQKGATEAASTVGGVLTSGFFTAAAAAAAAEAAVRKDGGERYA
jgi:hypothetical protein